MRVANVGQNLLVYGNRANRQIFSLKEQIRTGEKKRNTGGNETDASLTSEERQQRKARQKALLESNRAVQTLSADGKKVYQGQSARSWLEQSKQYRDALLNARINAGEKKAKMKRLRYDFKGIASQILRSKTARCAKEAASKARREVNRLRKLKVSEGYDEEELMAAISHAKAMERVAKKKVKHLLQEEMVKNRGCAFEIEEKEKCIEEGKENFSPEDAAIEKKQKGAFSSVCYDQGGSVFMAEEEMFDQKSGLETVKAIRQIMKDSFADFSLESMTVSGKSTDAILLKQMEDLTEEMMDEMAAFLEDMGLEELDGQMVACTREMDESDRKLMKIKHRCKEMKDMAEADGEYLKVFFGKLQEQHSEGAMPPTLTGGFDVLI